MFYAMLMAKVTKSMAIKERNTKSLNSFCTAVEKEMRSKTFIGDCTK
jgi:hypothetical protein